MREPQPLISPACTHAEAAQLKIHELIFSVEITTLPIVGIVVMSILCIILVLILVRVIAACSTRPQLLTVPTVPKMSSDGANHTGAISSTPSCHIVSAQRGSDDGFHGSVGFQANIP